MAISYRFRRRVGFLLRGVILILVAALVACFCWVIWLERYIVYTEDGAVLDFGISLEFPSGQVAVPPEPMGTIPIQTNPGKTETEDGKLPQLHGYYVDTDLLLKNINAVKKQLEQLPKGTPVLIDVKNIYGRFYYTSSVDGGAQASKPNNAKMDELLEYMESRDLYMIARLPAFRDYYFGLHHVSSGIYHSSGGYLWMDSSRCYWLNPAKDRTLRYLIEIANELEERGFDEVVFTEFRYPDSEDIKFTGSKTKEQILSAAAQTLVTACASSRFCVSFTADVEFKLPVGYSRLYLSNVPASEVADKVEQLGLETPEVSVVFYATVNDTRYDAYCVLRPLADAIIQDEVTQ